jgi:transcriptional regulator with XRE-family HTH domain
MYTNELLEKVKEKQGLKSDYQLAKNLGISTGHMSEYKSGKRIPDIYALTRIAIILEIDPLKVIVEMEAETEKNEVKREFWRSFQSSWSRAAVTTIAEDYLHTCKTEAQNGKKNIEHKPPLWEVAEKLINRFGGFFSSGNRERLRNG